MIKTIHFSLSISLSIYLSIPICIYLSIHLCLFLFLLSMLFLCFTLFFLPSPLFGYLFISLSVCLYVSTGKPYGRGRLNTVDLLVLTCIDQLLYKLNNFLPFFTKRSHLNEEGNLSEPFPSVRIPWSLPIASGYSNVLVVPSSLSIQTYTHFALLLKTA